MGEQPIPAPPARAAADVRGLLTRDETLTLLGAWQDLGPAHRRIFLDLIRSTARLRLHAADLREG